MTDWGKLKSPGYSGSTIGQGTGFAPSPGYWDSKIGAGEGFDTSKYGHGDSKSGGTYAWEVGLALIFWDEMRRYQNSQNPPTFDGGMILEVTQDTRFHRKAKTKLQGAGTTVMIDIGSNTNIKKGMYALVLCKSSNSGGTFTYTIVSAKDVGSSTTDDSSEYSV